MVESFWIKEVNDLVMELKRMKKALVVVVILLFLGVGFQPATANEISTNPIFDVDEDCFECQPVSRVDLLKVKLLLIRLKSFTNVISSKYGYIPEVAEKCEEISDRITGTSLQDNPPICYLLLIALISMFPLVGIMELILLPFDEDTPLYQIVWYLLLPYRLFMASYLVSIMVLVELYDCNFFPGPGP